MLAYQVARRTRELGVRRALGASRKRVVRDVVRGGAALAPVLLFGMAIVASLVPAARAGRVEPAVALRTD